MLARSSGNNLIRLTLGVFVLMFLVVMGALYLRKRPPDTAHRVLEYEIVGEDVQDAPRETIVTSRIVIGRDAGHDEIRAVLGRVFAGITRTKFGWHNPPTTVQLYAYDSKQTAQQATDEWIAALHYGPYDHCHPDNNRDPKKPAPEIRFREPVK
jgi:hypothetical protein